MKNKFKILVVDDEVLIAEFLKHTLITLGYIQPQLAHNFRQAVIQLEEFQPDLVLLDIRMKTELEGIEIATLINSKYKIPFIFITAHSDKEIIQKALHTNPAGYITKPFKQMDVFAAVQLVENNYEKEQEFYLIFKDGYDTIKLSADEILYAQSNDNYISIFTNQRKYVIRNTLEWFGNNTPNHLFHRTHRSAIVNVTKISKTTSKSVFIGNIEIPVSRGNRVNISNLEV